MEAPVSGVLQQPPAGGAPSPGRNLISVLGNEQNGAFFA
jgi:hypothetical protein